MKTVYLDTETTGLSAEDEIVELTIIDDNEEVLINTSWIGYSLCLESDSYCIVSQSA